MPAIVRMKGSTASGRASDARGCVPRAIRLSLASSRSPYARSLLYRMKQTAIGQSAGTSVLGGFHCRKGALNLQVMIEDERQPIAVGYRIAGFDTSFGSLLVTLWRRHGRYDLIKNRHGFSL